MRKELIKSFLMVGILLAAVFLILYGIMNGEIMTVYNKAVNICMECIGIG